MNVQNSELLRKKKIAQDDKDFASDKISQLARLIGFGLAAATLVFLTSDSAFAQKVMKAEKIWILGVSALGCVVILCDWLQYVFGFIASQNAFENAAGEHKYRTDSFAYKMRWRLFYWKQYCATAGAFVFIIILIVGAFL